MRILIMAPEMVPYAKTSEVANVVTQLGLALRRLGHDVRMAMPRYKHIDRNGFGLRTCVDALDVPMHERLGRATVLGTQTAEGLPVYMIDNPRYFGEHVGSMYIHDADPFVFYCRATLEMLKHPQINWQPDVVHCHDWQTALVPNLLKTIYNQDSFLGQIASVFTIHRISHQGIFGYRTLEAAGIKQYGFIYYSGIADLDELVDLLGRGIYYCDAITTVSERYAREIQTPEFGEQLDPLLRDRNEQLFGIRNGIDVEAFDPARDERIAAQYDLATLEKRRLNKAALQRFAGLEEKPDAPLIAMITRLTDIKGLDLVLDIVGLIIQHLGAQLFIMGTGEHRHHERLHELSRTYNGHLSLNLHFDETVQHQVFAGSDMFLMPSRVEPCGLGQMVAMRYGAIPIVRSTGGLADTVQNYEPRLRTGNGFTFSRPDRMALYTTIVRAVEAYGHRETWHSLQERGMKTDFSWSGPAAKYEQVYEFAHRQRAATRNADGTATT